MIYILIILWVAMIILGYGMLFADTHCCYDDRKVAGHMLLFSIVFNFLPVIGLFIIFLITGFAENGLRFSWKEIEVDSEPQNLWLYKSNGYRQGYYIGSIGVKTLQVPPNIEKDNFQYDQFIEGYKDGHDEYINQNKEDKS